MTPLNNDNEIVFLRLDLDRSSDETGTAFYRLDDGLLEFIERIDKDPKNPGGIEGIVLTRKEDGSISRNIGFVVKYDRQKVD